MSIDNLKSIISKKSGLAKANRFLVIFTPPTQPLANLSLNNVVGKLARGQNPLKNFITNPRDIAFLCENASLPGRQITTSDFSAQKQTIKIPNGFIEEDVSMSFILTNDFFMKEVFDTWLSGIVDTSTYTLGYKSDYQTDITIQTLDDDDKPTYSITLINAYPITIGSVELDNSSENTYLKLPVTFAYDRYTEKDIISGSLGGLLSAIPDRLLPNKISSGLNKIKSLF
tara:strand:- start:7290 stop:7973 length:684 start_codon:yes stop_codon:yes gene_type:complete